MGLPSGRPWTLKGLNGILPLLCPLAIKQNALIKCLHNDYVLQEWPGAKALKRPCSKCRSHPEANGYSGHSVCVQLIVSFRFNQARLPPPLKMLMRSLHYGHYTLPWEESNFPLWLLIIPWQLWGMAQVTQIKNASCLWNASCVLSKQIFWVMFWTNVNINLCFLSRHQRISWQGKDAPREGDAAAGGLSRTGDTMKVIG